MKYKYICIIGQRESNYYNSKAKAFESDDSFEAFEKAVKYGESFTREKSFLNYSIWGIGKFNSCFKIMNFDQHCLVDIETPDYAQKYIEILNNIDNELERGENEI